MFDLDPALIGKLAGLLSLAAYSIYLFAIIRGTTKPSRSTWWILTLVGTAVLASYWLVGARATIWIALSYVIGPFLIALLSLKYGEGSGWDKTDKACFLISLGSLILWLGLIFPLGVSQSALIVLLINLLADFVGLVPTIKKSYQRPEFENAPAWFLESVASLLTILAVRQWAFAIWIYPVYLASVNGLITGLIFRPKMISIWRQLTNSGAQA